MAPNFRKPAHLVDLKDSVKKQEERVKRSICSVGFFITAVKTLILIGFYYCFSIGLTFYNQRMFHHNGIAMSVTMCHLVFKFVLAGLIRSIMQYKTQESRIVLDWSSYVKRIAAAGIVSSLDIGLSNWSFEFVTVSLYTMSKSTAVIFILVFSIMFRLERFRWNLLVIVSFIFMGLFLFTFHSTQFDMKGFTLVMTASVLSGLRWTLAQLVMQKNEIGNFDHLIKLMELVIHLVTEYGLHNPIDMMYHIQPWMILALLPLSASIEGLNIAGSTDYFRFTEWSVLFKSLSLVLFGGMLGFMLEFSEFLLVCKTSGLTLSVAGIFKELCIFLLAVFINGDPISSLNAVGLIICVIGISIHVITKAVNSNEEKRSTSKSLNGSAESLEMLRNGKANDDSEDSEVDLFSVDRDR